MTRPEGPTIHDKPSDHNEHRMRRAKSWLAQSEKADSAEEKFICLWIAFNAAYGDEPTNRDEDDGETKGETKRFTKFLKDIIERDERKEGEIRDILWKAFNGAEEDHPVSSGEPVCVRAVLAMGARRSERQGLADAV